MEPVTYPVELFADALGKAFQLAHLALHAHSDPEDKAQNRRVFILGAKDLSELLFEQISDAEVPVQMTELSEFFLGTGDESFPASE